MSATILIVDDDLSLREVLDISLNNAGYGVFSAPDTGEARRLLRTEPIDLVLLDLKLGNESGLDFLREIRQNYPDVPVLMITAFSETQSAVEAMKLGASDFISKPFDLEDFLQVVNETIQDLPDPSQTHPLEIRERGYYSDIIGNSPCMLRVFQMVRRMSRTSINVLITGESGTGKELIARAIHEESERSGHPFVPINCGGLPDTLFESELFGYKKGAFTGADTSKPGFLDTAAQGTLFLDEVAELSSASQVKLLRCLQEKTFVPLGSTLEKEVSARFISATNRDLTRMLGSFFREDLFYRLSGVIINVPPLRERGEDIYNLAHYFLDKASKRQNKFLKGFSDMALQKIQGYSFPGNVRELENLVERAVALEQGDTISSDSIIIYDLSSETCTSAEMDPEQVTSGELTLDEYLLDKEKYILEVALKKTSGQRTEAARLLGLNLRKLRYRLKKVGLDD
jgi:two-component system response regulator PilR (NtrC family)